MKQIFNNPPRGWDVTVLGITKQLFTAFLSKEGYSFHSIDGSKGYIAKENASLRFFHSPLGVPHISSLDIISGDFHFQSVTSIINSEFIHSNSVGVKKDIHCWITQENDVFVGIKKLYRKILSQGTIVSSLEVSLATLEIWVKEIEDKLWK